jgi:serine/threonine protein kinase
MPDSAHKVLHELTAAGLLSADQATKFDAELKTGSEALLSRLVADGHITEYQAQKFRDGQASDIYFGDYVVLDKLGQGGMGTVLLAKHRRMDREVAIKVLPVTVLDSKAAVARFFQEVKVAAQLTHPNIVHAYDAGEHHGFQYLVMEFVPGHDLARVLSELGPIPPMLALDYITQAAAGLQYAHRKGVVHRDIKPSNLLLDDEGMIKILDMGLARIGGGFDDEDSRALTTTGQMMGTVEYMSPEQAEDTRVADARSDIYSLGCTLYRLITGNGPFTRDTVVKTILAHRDAKIPSIAMGFPEDPMIENLFQKMIAKNPDDRFQSTTLLLEALRAIAEGESMTEFPSNPVPAPAQSYGASRTESSSSGTGSVDAIGKDGSSTTAVAYRVSGSDPLSGSIPEAIIPTDTIEPVSTGSISTGQVNHSPSPNLGSADAPLNAFAETQSGHSTSDVLYIKDDSFSQKFRGLFSRFFGWFKANPCSATLIRGIIAVLASGLLGLFAIILGAVNWRVSTRQLRMIKNDEMKPQGRWMLRLGRVLSILAIVLAILSWTGAFG